MARTRSIPLGTYPSGTREFGPFSTPNGLSGFDIRIGSCTSVEPTIWSNPATVVTVAMQFSYDGGVTYSPLGANSWKSNGGIKLQRGAELIERVMSWRFAPDEPTNFKGQITVQNGPITTYLDATFL